MTQKKKNAVPGSTAFKDCSAQQANASNYTQIAPKVHQIVQADRLRHRFGMSTLRAAVTANLAYGGGAS